MLDMQKAMELKKIMEQVTAKLDTISVTGEAGDGKYKVTATATGNKKIKDIQISDELLAQGDKDYLQDLLLTAVNRALENAQNVADAEGRNAAMSGMFGL